MIIIQHYPSFIITTHDFLNCIPTIFSTIIMLLAVSIIIHHCPIIILPCLVITPSNTMFLIHHDRIIPEFSHHVCWWNHHFCWLNHNFCWLNHHFCWWNPHVFPSFNSFWSKWPPAPNSAHPSDGGTHAGVVGPGKWARLPGPPKSRGFSGDFIGFQHQKWWFHWILASKMVISLDFSTKNGDFTRFNTKNGDFTGF